MCKYFLRACSQEGDIDKSFCHGAERKTERVRERAGESERGRERVRETERQRQRGRGTGSEERGSSRKEGLLLIDEHGDKKIERIRRVRQEYAITCTCTCYGFRFS